MEHCQPTRLCRVCAWCGRCWKDETGWNHCQDTHIHPTTHGICAECAKKAFHRKATETKAVMPTPADTRRTAADTLYHLARQIELGKIEVQGIDSDRPLVRTPGAMMNPDETKRGQPVTFTLRYIDSGAVRA